MTGPALTADAVGVRASYFYLSYAHSPPLEGARDASHDRWVRSFYTELAAAVRRHAPRRRSHLVTGFYDQEIPLDSNWKALLTRALSAAEVFVPLYSEGYFTRSWPGREWACFQQRLTDAEVSEPLSRVIPVLWVPLPPGRTPPALDRALALGAGDQVYLDNGLAAMLRLTPYRARYEAIVERLAAQIVDLAESSPLAPSPVPDIDDMQSAFSPSESTALLAVAVMASAGTAWRPFREQQLSLADYAATIGEQLDFAVLITDAKAGGQFDRNPGALLIDPAVVANSRDQRMLRDLARELPAWVVPVIVLDSSSGERVTEDVRTVKAILESTSHPRTEPMRRALRGIGSLADFVALMPFLIAEAERQYLRHGPIERTVAPAGSRPRLSDGEGGTR
ncbi:MAG TPA: TIR-like protein FxsC [Streptosporangiaceae bacterium]|nr:TIR-like protein FxsC [Streptosporangiaceae bacterium]